LITKWIKPCKVFRHSKLDLYSQDYDDHSTASIGETDGKALTPNQAIFIEEIRERNRRKPEDDRILDYTPSGKRTFWSAADYAFWDGPTELWTKTRVSAVWKTLLNLKFVKAFGDGLAYDKVEVQEKTVGKLKVRIPDIRLILYQSELEVLRRLLEKNRTKTELLADHALRDDYTLNDFVDDGLISLKVGLGFGTYFLTKWQRERAFRIVAKKAGDSVIIRPDPKTPPPPRPYSKFATDQERLEARRKQKREWWKKHRAK